jgi:putative phage-type endonuclease
MITPTQLAARRNYIGSSDAAAILGLDPFKSAYDVWLEKTADIEPDTSSEAAEIGNWIEPLLCKWAEDQVGWRMRMSPDTFVSPCGILAANLDAIEDDDEPTHFIEAKSTGLADDWGDEGTDQVPPRVVTQTAIAFACVHSLRVAWIPLLLGKHGLRRKLYRVNRDDGIVDAVADKCRAFWRDHVLTRTPPPGTAPNLDLLARIRREPESCVDLDDTSLLDQWEDAKAKAKEANEAVDAAKARLIASLGAAESGRLADGRLVTYLQQTRKQFTTPANTFRVLRTKESKP